ncbi:hypothetical protein EDC01DRAFT_635886 [Geopyxis carbonaria]|nr:hypothetical protein EDC01DRAFT_635886 [Geopyxis carbonaria]
MSGLRSLARLPSNLWGFVFHPVPALMSSAVAGSDFLLPLAFFALLMTLATMWNQLLLFCVSAFGVVWVDTQMAWKAIEVTDSHHRYWPCRLCFGAYADEEQVGKMEMDAYVQHSMDCVRAGTLTQMNQTFQSTPEKVDESTLVDNDKISAPFDDNISATAQVPTSDLPALELDRLQTEIEHSLMMQQQELGSRYSSYESLETVVEEDEELGEIRRKLSIDFEPVLQEASAILAQTRAPQLYRTMESVSEKLGPIPTISAMPPPLPPRKPLPQHRDNTRDPWRSSRGLYSGPDTASLESVLDAMPTAITEVAMEDHVSNILSLEDLEETSAPQSSASSLRASSSSASSMLDGYTRAPEMAKQRSFPIIEDVLSEYEASLRGDDAEHEAGHGIFSDEGESRPESPATTYSTDEELDTVPAAKQLETPQSLQKFDLPPIVQKAAEKAIAKLPPATKKKVEKAIAKLPPKIPVSFAQLQAAKKKQQQARGRRGARKRVPKKARLSRAGKKRFVSRGSW